MMLTSTMVLAHLTGGHGFVDGFAHPLFGLDHLLAMVSVGILATLIGGRSLWALPLSFLGTMVLGAVLGMMGPALPGVELAIALSVVALGLGLLFGQSLSLKLAMPLVASMAVFHGYAHGAEMPIVANAWLYGTGFLLGTALFHGLGIVTGQLLQMLPRPVLAMRFVGLAIAGAGLSLLPL